MPSIRQAFSRMRNSLRTDSPWENVERVVNPVYGIHQLIKERKADNASDDAAYDAGVAQRRAQQAARAAQGMQDAAVQPRPLASLNPFAMPQQSQGMPPALVSFGGGEASTGMPTQGGVASPAAQMAQAIFRQRLAQRQQEGFGSVQPRGATSQLPGANMPVKTGPAQRTAPMAY